MMQARSHIKDQDPHAGVVESFVRFLRNRELESCEGKETGQTAGVKHRFVCVTAVREYLEGDSEEHEPLQELLDKMCQPNADQKPFHEDILSSKTPYIAMLCILTCIGKGNYINDFVTAGLDDGKLPLDPISPPPDFPDTCSTGKHDFFQKFCDTQWMFCVPHFTMSMHKRYKSDLRLPITKKTQIGSGGSEAELHEIVIHACYNKFHREGQDRPRKKCFSTSDEKLNTFVLKTYKSLSDYEAENKAYRELRDIRYIVPFYGSYNYNNEDKIILKQADEGSLEDYFRTQTPPSESGDICKFWRNLCPILNALHNIHHVEQESWKWKSREVSRGWHQDVQPGNILVFRNNKSSPYEFTFRLADFGTSRFMKVSEYGVDNTASGSHGTKTYGAPECKIPRFWEESPVRVTQKIDIWSFGCILSEAAVWVNSGYEEGVQRYRRDLAESSKDPGLATCFHDGEGVRHTVLDWHVKVRRTKRESDMTTDVILRHIEDYMLCQDANERLEANTLWTRLEKVLHQPSNPLINSDMVPGHPATPYAPPPPSLIPPRSEPTTAQDHVHDIASHIPEQVDINSTSSTHLQEQHEILNNCKEILSLIEKANQYLEENDPRLAKRHFGQANEVVITTSKFIAEKSEAERPSNALSLFLCELCLDCWTGLTKCELSFADHAIPPLSIEEQKKHLRTAKRCADQAERADEAYKSMIRRINPGSKKCEALELVKNRQ